MQFITITDEIVVAKFTLIWCHILLDWQNNSDLAMDVHSPCS
jgi:hypothetical protein